MKNKIIIMATLLIFINITNMKAQDRPAIQKQKNMNNTDLATLRKNKVITYFKKVDEGQFDEEYFNLYTDDVEMYYPKFGFEKGKNGIMNFGKVMGAHLQSLSHDIDNFKYVISDHSIVVEGTERGITRSGKEWPDYKTSHGKFCNVFEFEDEFIKRIHVYVDPDFTSEDADRVNIFKNPLPDINNESQKATKQVVDEFFALQSGKKEGNIIDLFSDYVDWDLPGNKQKFPWTGKRQTKKEIEEFFKELYSNVKPEKFEIDFIAVNGENATATGHLSSKILAYNKVFSTEFVVIFKVVHGKIVKYHFIEDSYQLNEEMQSKVIKVQ
ncbi:nuclear transport factor 2 family protein [Chryseobacterium gleum]|uniref:nuclear transport factor 2 family protein n=1 Tax=Chryseobacterium gleum TaxID=250 RepID=UPI001E344028|nr:nuclear transport factor 2 family protein [Chryseobacterium gleum]MCD9616987.1 nuclear transport factor 2 family protein [Chryseobacterium gleum]